MQRRSFSISKTRVTVQRNAAIFSHRRRQTPVQGKRARGGDFSELRSWIPPEDWHEPREDNSGRYKIVWQSPGAGYRHVLTVPEVRARLAELPAWMTRGLEVVQFSRMTRKKRTFPCYGMQWGRAIYLYPIEEDLIEYYHRPPLPAQQIEARVHGGVWEQVDNQTWKLVWTEEAIKDYYLNNILLHELGHLLDDRNSSYKDRERYAEWFAIQYGVRASRKSPRPMLPASQFATSESSTGESPKPKTTRRHHRKGT